jgi:hypothetical protein
MVLVVGFGKPPWFMDLNDFLNTLLFWKTTQFHALAAKQPLAPVPGLSRSSSTLCETIMPWSGLQMEWATTLSSSTKRVDADRLLGFSNRTHIKGDILVFGAVPRQRLLLSLITPSSHSHCGEPEHSRTKSWWTTLCSPP